MTDRRTCSCGFPEPQDAAKGVPCAAVEEPEEDDGGEHGQVQPGTLGRPAQGQLNWCRPGLV